MSWFPQAALNDGVQKREVFGWAMYDFANSGYTTVVLTAVFNAYFVGVVAQGASWATLAWTLCIAVSSAITMFTVPALGAHADQRGAKKRLLAWTTAGCVVATVGLAFCGRGDVALAAVAVVVSNVFYSYGEALNAAFLPELSRREALGRVSGWGWSFGYFGGMLSLGLSLAYVLWAQAQGQQATQFVPVTMLITAGVYGLASLATFALLKERARPQPAAATAQGGFGEALARLARTAREAGQYRDFAWLMACSTAYQAGIAVVIALAAVYAEQALGFQQTDTMALVFAVNIASAGGAFLFGYWQDRIGHRRALGATLVGWLVMTLLAYLATSPALFWVAAVLAGLCMGSSQSAGRALAGVLAPADRLAEFFGLWTFATRLAAIVGPLTYGLVTWLTAGNHRLAILSTGAFFLMGLALLRPIDVARGMRAAGQGGTLKS
ncbi:MFS transporter [Aquincola tertiaricarbonis]|uniref:MFS transporter n=1 Tax=Aquincola tertiaricarbonis TaxID=391953 RepID=A0ABY4SCC4_AQUTE|nr:MFS transporter [Aquincola tertiaricarbonis]URI08879.1 MFS transporter [Aquincola tertiaricarbonis]